jgi:HKD family nuclease
MQVVLLGPSPSSIKFVPLWQYLKNRLIKSKRKGSRFRLAVAYAQESYEPLLRKVMQRFAINGGVIEAVVGINGNGTSAKALRGLLEICGPSNLFVYYNPANGVFHPKFYIISDELSASVIIGSSNLTVSGISNNFEISVAIELNLASTKDASMLISFESLFDDIKRLPSSRLLDKTLLQLLSDAGALCHERVFSTEDAISGSLQGELRQYFDPTPHPTIRIRRYATSIPYQRARPNTKRTGARLRFVMTLAEHDVSGLRGEPYFLVPIEARSSNPSFWGWYRAFAPSRVGGFPERMFKARVRIGATETTENCRLYFLEPRDEFRLKCAPIHKLGRAYAGSFVVIKWKNTRRGRIALIDLTQKGEKLYGELAKLPFNVHTMGKKWAYY